jgi:hypothetical protein
MNCLILSEFGKCVEFSAQHLFRKFLMNKRVTTPTQVNAAFLHIRFGKMLLKPLITMTAFRDKMMEGNEIVGPTQCTNLDHARFLQVDCIMPKLVPGLKGFASIKTDHKGMSRLATTLQTSLL